jgi:hypothetical protein
VFGISPIVDENAMMGNYYYFTDFERAVENYIKFCDPSEDALGVVRFAVFLGASLTIF